MDKEAWWFEKKNPLFFLGNAYDLAQRVAYFCYVFWNIKFQYIWTRYNTWMTTYWQTPPEPEHVRTCLNTLEQELEETKNIKKQWIKVDKD